MLTVEQRLTNLENLVHALSQKIDNNKYYTDADMQGNRQSISNVTPYTVTKTAYIGDTEVVFADLPNGAYNVSFDKTVSVTKVTKEVFNGETSTITVDFEPLEEITNITISIQ